MRTRFPELGTERSKETYKLVGGEPGLTQDRAENAALYVGGSVVWDDDAYGGTIRMLQDVMAAGDMVDEKAGTLQCPDQSRGADRGQIGHALASSTVSLSVIGPSGAS